LKTEAIIAFKLSDLIESGKDFTHKGKKVSPDTFFYGQGTLYFDVPFFSMDKENPMKHATILLKEPLHINHAAELARRGKGVPKPKSAENGKKGGRPRKKEQKEQG
jgi:hypothetical protein